MFPQDNKSNIYVLEWGATMRLANFFIVKKETARTITVLEIETLERQTDSGEVAEPKYEDGRPVIKFHHGELKEYRATKHAIYGGRTVSIKWKFGKGNSHTATLWDGKPVSICTID